MRIQPFIVVAVLCCGGSAYADRPEVIDSTRSDEVVLTHQFDRGNVRNYAVDFTQYIESLEGSDSETTVSGNVQLVYEVQSVEDGVGTVSSSIRSASLSVEEDGRGWDTATVVDGWESARVTQVVRADGTLAESTGQLADDETEANLTGTLVDLLESAWVDLPTEPLAIGDQWVNSTQLWLGENVDTVQATQTTRLTLAGYAIVNGIEHAVIDVTYRAEISGELPLDNTGRNSLQVIGRVEGTGYILFDHNRGVVTEAGSTNGQVLTYTDSVGGLLVQAIDMESTLVLQP